MSVHVSILTYISAIYIKVLLRDTRLRVRVCESLVGYEALFVWGCVSVGA